MHLKLVELFTFWLALFLELLLMNFTESECWWTNSTNLPVKMRDSSILQNTIKVLQ